MEIIVAAAIKDGNGKIWSLPPKARHHTIFAEMRACGGSHIGSVQGFLTNCGRFVEREEALKIALAAQQLVTHLHAAKLFTEDLW